MNAIILAGGRGTRLQPWFSAKTLIPVAGVSILRRSISHLWEDLVSVDRIVVCTGHHANDVEAHLESYRNLVDDFPVVTSYAGEAAAMGERLIAARELAGNGRLLICYGDELVDLNIAALVAKHESSHALMTFAAAEARVPGGTVYEDDDAVRIIDEAARWVNIGFVVVEPECWVKLRLKDGLSDWVNRMSEDHERVAVYYHKGKRVTVNSLADLKYAEEIWNAGKQ